MPDDGNDIKRPFADIKNNTWFHAADSDTVFVFVHGLLSDSRGAWLHEARDDPSKNAYWPELIRTDPNFDGVSIFLAGFYTELDSGQYNARDAAKEIFRSLSIRIEPADRAVLDKKNILFITHSTGGVVIRHMLTREAAKFADKNVGLILIASPSIGSRDADRLAFVAAFARNELGKSLQWNHPFLNELDNDFKNLVHERMIPHLQGEEWLEHHLIGGSPGKAWGLFREAVLVEKESAARYFGEPVTLAGANHITAVKPPDRGHPAYVNLRYFYEQKFRPRQPSRKQGPDREGLPNNGQTERMPSPTGKSGKPTTSPAAKARWPASRRR
jgi:hypothetical protein